MSDNCEAARLLPRYTGQIADNSDSLEIDLVLLDPVSGELLAMAGSPRVRQTCPQRKSETW